MKNKSTTPVVSAASAVQLHNFTPEQVALIKAQIAPKATDDELILFLYVATQTKLNPLTRQIYAIHRKTKISEQDEQGRWRDKYVDKMTIQTSIDGFRVIAERTGQYGGVSEPEFFYDEQNNLDYCKITVYRWRDNIRYEAATAVAFWEEYCPEYGSSMWKKMPHGQLSKVAEALALRKAFPQDLSSLYIEEEMQQADNDLKEDPQPQEQRTPSKELPAATEKFTADDMNKAAPPELREAVLALWAEWNDISPEDAAPLNPLVWDKNSNRPVSAYLRAEEALKSKIAAFENSNP